MTAEAVTVTRGFVTTQYLRCAPLGFCARSNYITKAPGNLYENPASHVMLYYDAAVRS